MNEKPITIIQIIPAMHSGGVERGVLEFSKKLVNLGYNSIVISSGGSLVNLLEKNGVKHIELNIQSKNPAKIFNNITKLKNIFKKLSPDIVHVRSRAPMISAYYACKGNKKIKLVSTVHGPYSTCLFNEKPSIIKKLYNSFMLRADHVIAVSSFVKDYILHNYQNIGPEKVTIIHRGVDEEIFDPDKISISRTIDLSKKWGIDEEKSVILFPARITAWKGHEFLINALKIVDKNYICVFIGSDHGHERYSKKIKQKIIDEGLSGKIKFLGNQKDMPLAYSIANVVISASTKPEAFGRISIEAQAMKKIIVATNIGGSLETIENEKTGFLVENKDANDFAKKITQSLDLDQEQRDTICQNARINILKNFTNKKMFEYTEKVYKSLL